VYLLILILLANFLIAQNADEIVGRSISIVDESDKKIESLSGEFKLRVKLNYNLTVRKGNYDFVYDVKFKDGVIKERKLVSLPNSIDSSSLRIARQIERIREGENLKVKNLIFPFLRVRDNLKINYKLNGIEKLNGKDCFVIAVDYKVKSDTVSSEGNGKIWIDKESYVPIRCEYDVTYESKRFGKNNSKQFLDISRVGSIIMIERNITQVFPKVLFIKFGKVEITYEPHNFKFENKSEGTQ